VLYDLEMSAETSTTTSPSLGWCITAATKRNGSFAIAGAVADIEDFAVEERTATRPKARIYIWCGPVYEAGQDDLTWTAMCPDRCLAVGRHSDLAEVWAERREGQSSGRISGRRSWTHRDWHRTWCTKDTT
jgi:hypothetical protein